MANLTKLPKITTLNIYTNTMLVTSEIVMMQDRDLDKYVKDLKEHSEKENANLHSLDVKYIGLCQQMQEISKQVRGTWDIKPEEYDLKRLKEYGNRLLIEIIKMLDKSRSALTDKCQYLVGEQERLTRENKTLKDEVERLKVQSRNH